MVISIIVAMNEQRVIGANNQLPWYLPADLQHFKMITWGKPIVMGRRTFLSIGKPLPGRSNIVLTHDKNFLVSGCVIVNNIEQALDVASSSSELMVIGGAQIYQQFLPLTQRIYLTEVDCQVSGDTFFPEYDKKTWREVSRQTYAADKNNIYGYSFVVLEKN